MTPDQQHVDEARQQEAREWASLIIHALDPHRGGYTRGAMDELRVKARAFAGSDAEAASLVQERADRQERITQLEAEIFERPIYRQLQERITLLEAAANDVLWP